MMHFKKTLALLLAVVMLLGIAPVAAFAETVVTRNKPIDSVSIYGGKVPRLGEQPSYSQSVHTFDEKKFEFVGTPEWYEVRQEQAARKMSSTETYQNGCTYFLKIKLRSIVKAGAPYESYWFTDASVLIPNYVVCYDNNVHHQSYVFTGNGDTNRERTILFLFRFDDTRVLVTFDPNGGVGYMDPVLVRNNYTQLTVPQCDFTKAGVVFKRWKNNNYTNTYYIPGSKEYLQGNTVLKADWGTDHSSQTKLSTVTFTGGELPQFNQHPSYNWSLSGANSAKMEITSVAWHNETTSKVMTASDVFEIGHFYHLYLTVKAKKDCYFPLNNEGTITVTLNGISTSRYGVKTNSVEAGVYIDLAFCCARPFTASNVTFARPFPGDTASKLNVTINGETSTKLKADSVQWYLGDSVYSPGSKLSSTATFEASKSYIAEIKLYGRDWNSDIKTDAKVTYAGHFPMTFIKRVTENGIFVNYYRIKFTLPAIGSQLKSMTQTVYEPQAGGKPNSALLTTSSDYASDFVGWYIYNNGSRGTKLGENDTFVSGQKYIAMVNMTAAPTTYFGENASCFINGVKAKTVGVLNSDGSRYYQVVLGTLPYYSVSFNTDGGTSVASQKVVKGECITKPVNPSKSGYSFAGWYTTAELTTAFNFATQITSNRTLYAKWTENAVHLHNYSILGYNENYHWYECSCGNKNVNLSHVYDNSSDATCNVCGYVRAVEQQHVHAYLYVMCNADYHWYECSCGDKVSYEEHVYDNGSDTTCNVCGYIRSVSVHVHNYLKTASNADYHWYECSCGDKVGFEEHVFDNANDATCNVCGYKREVSDHQHNYIDMIVSADEYDVGYTMHYCEGCDASYTDTYTAPTAKLSLKCAARTAAAEKLGWKKVENANGYQVQISTKDGKKWSTYATIKTNATVNYTFKKLAAGNNYKFRVRFYITVEGKNYYSPWSKTLASPTLPTGTSLSKISAGKKSFSTNWKRNSAVTGYQIQYSLKDDFSGAKTVTIKSNKTLKTTLKKLNAKKVYYVRIRTYKTISKVNYFSVWNNKLGGKAAKVKTK